MDIDGPDSQSQLPPVVIDGANVIGQYSNRRGRHEQHAPAVLAALILSIRESFLKKGFLYVITVLPKSMQGRQLPADMSHALWAPARDRGDDDLFALTYTHDLDGYLLSNDYFRDHVESWGQSFGADEGQRLAEFVRARVITYAWAGTTVVPHPAIMRTAFLDLKDRPQLAAMTTYFADAVYASVGTVASSSGAPNSHPLPLTVRPHQNDGGRGKVEARAPGHLAGAGAVPTQIAAMVVDDELPQLHAAACVAGVATAAAAMPAATVQVQTEVQSMVHGILAGHIAPPPLLHAIQRLCHDNRIDWPAVLSMESSDSPVQAMHLPLQPVVVQTENGGRRSIFTPESVIQVILKSARLEAEYYGMQSTRPSSGHSGQQSSRSGSYGGYGGQLTQRPAEDVGYEDVRFNLWSPFRCALLLEGLQKVQAQR